jgi:O-antigen ligase
MTTRDATQSRWRRFPALARSPRLELVLLALVIFALPLFIWPGVTEYNYAKCIFLLIALSLVTVVHVAGAARRREHTLHVPWIAFPVLGLVAVSLLSLLGATNARVGVQSLVVVLAFLQFAFLVVNVVRERRDVTLLLSALFASACLVALHAFLQYLGTLPGTGSSTEAANMIATMGNQDAVGGFLAYLLLPAIILVNRSHTWPLRFVTALLVLFCLAAVLMTHQTGVLLGLLAAVVAILIGWVLFPPGPERQKRSLLPILLLVLVGALLATTAFFFLTSPGGTSTDGTSRVGLLWEANAGNDRAYYWSIGWTMLKEHPVAGAGLGNYKIDYMTSEAAYLAEPGATPPNATPLNAAQAHSDYVQAAAELGSLGALAVVALLLVLALSLWKRLRQRVGENRFDLLLLSGGVLVFLVHALVGFPAHWAAPALAALLLGSLALSPAYGTSATLQIRLTRRALRVGLIFSVLAGLAVSIVAGRDLAANILQLRGTRYVQMGQDQMGLDTLRQSIALDFAPRQSYFYLASAQYRLGKYDDALNSLAMCFSRFPDENAYLLYADLAAGLGQLDRGLEILDFLLSTSPLPDHENKARYVRALVLREKGDLAGSEAALRELIAKAPKYEASYGALAEILSRSGRVDEAREFYLNALSLIDAALPTAVAALEERRDTPMTYSTYAEMRDLVERLTREKDVVLRGLEALGAHTP